MSDAVILALIASVPGTIAAVVAALVSWRNSAKTETLKAKTVDLIQKTDQIHTLTNSNLSKVTEQLAAATTKIGDLQIQVAILMGKKTLVSPPEGLT